MNEPGDQVPESKTSVMNSGVVDTKKIHNVSLHCNYFVIMWIKK